MELLACKRQYILEKDISVIINRLEEKRDQLKEEIDILTLYGIELRRECK